MMEEAHLTLRDWAGGGYTRSQVAAVESAWTTFCAEANHLGVDELRVLTALAQRLRKGREQYGPLSLARDKRDWGKERNEELQDALLYELFEGLR